MHGEFSFIEEKLEPLTYGNNAARNLKDDCAFFSSINNLVISVDNSVEGVHVPIGTNEKVQARRAVLRALSDIATFGATPICIFSAISIPKSIKSNIFEKIALGFKEALLEYDMFLAGGDTTSYDGPLMFSITVLGDSGVKNSGRIGAKQGDLVVVSGNIGSSFIGLKLISKEISRELVSDCDYFINKFLIPYPRISLAKKVCNFSSSIIDVSDGLLSDLKHICDVNGLGAKIDLKKIPLKEEVKKLVNSKEINIKDLLTAGDDYELLFTIDPKDSIHLDEDTTIIGKIVKDNNQKIVDENNEIIIADKAFSGFKHF